MRRGKFPFIRAIKAQGNIDVDSEEIVSLTEARKLFDPPFTRQTIFNYSNIGLNGVILESTIVHGQKMTSVEAVERFKQKLNGRADAR